MHRAKRSPGSLARLALLWMMLPLAGCTGADTHTGPDLPPPPPPPPDPVIVAAGDIACGSGTPARTPCLQAATAQLIGPIAPTAVLALGDIQYEYGTLVDFEAYYAPTWGAYKAITYPAPGNHEYQTSDAKGYYDYFNGVGVQTGRAGDRSKGYYSFDVGAWHLIALNSNCAAISGGCGAGSAQETWLRADLAAHPAVCTLAYWHHPRFSSGDKGNDAITQALWQALHDARADLVLTGHDHDYERFAPQNATGAPDPAGIVSFVVGTGGKERLPFGTVRANSLVRSSTSLGVLKLTLHAASFDWRFVPIPGDTLSDSGTASCVAANRSTTRTP